MITVVCHISPRMSMCHHPWWNNNTQQWSSSMLHLTVIGVSCCPCWKNAHLTNNTNITIVILYGSQRYADVEFVKMQAHSRARWRDHYTGAVRLSWSWLNTYRSRIGDYSHMQTVACTLVRALSAMGFTRLSCWLFTGFITSPTEGDGRSCFRRRWYVGRYIGKGIYV